jgi:arginine decarboxylase
VIDRFIDIHDERRFLELHKSGRGLYWIGFFLVGAYQDIIGDFYNLFGKVNELIIMVGDDGRPHVQKSIRGDTIRESITFVRYDPDELERSYQQDLNRKVKAGELTHADAKKMKLAFNKGLQGTTYLIPLEKNGKKRPAKRR